jgi:hypothetical protein
VGDIVDIAEGDIVDLSMNTVELVQDQRAAGWSYCVSVSKA